jgi:hypothetical protein
MGQLVNTRSFKLYYKTIWNNSWNFSNKYAYITNIMEDVYLEKFIFNSLYQISAGVFFFSHVRIEKIFNKYFFDIFFFDDFAATYFNNSIDTRNYKYRYTFLNKYLKKYSVNSKSFNLEVFFKKINKYKKSMLNLVKNKFNYRINNNFLNRKYFFNIQNYQIDLFNSKNKLKEFLFYSNKLGFDRFSGLNYKSFNFFYLFKTKKKNKLKKVKNYYNLSKKVKRKLFLKKIFHELSSKKQLNILNFKTKKIYNLINNVYFSYTLKFKNIGKKNLYFLININNFFRKIYLKKYLYFRKIKIKEGLSLNYYFNTILSLNFFILKNKSPFFSIKISKQYFKYFNLNFNMLNLINLNKIIKFKKLIYETKISSMYLNILNIDKLKKNNNDDFFFDLFIETDSSIIFLDEKISKNKVLNDYSSFLNNIFLISDSYLFQRISKVSKIFHYFLPKSSFNFLKTNYVKLSKYDNLSLKSFRIFFDKFSYWKIIRTYCNKFLNLRLYKRFLILNLFQQRVKNFHYLFVISMRYLKKMNKNINDHQRRFYYYSIRKGLRKLNKKTKKNNLKYLSYFRKIKRLKIYTKLSQLFKYTVHNSKIKIKTLNAWVSRTHYRTFKHLFKEYIFIFEAKPNIYMNKHLIDLGFYKNSENNEKNKIIINHRINNNKNKFKKNNNTEDDDELLEKKQNQKFFPKFIKLMNHIESVNGLSIRENINNNFLMSICFFLFFSSNEQYFKKLKVVQLFFSFKILKIFKNKNKEFCFNFFLLKDPTPEVISLYIIRKFYVKLSLPFFVKSIVHTVIRNFSNISGIFVKCKGRFTRRQRASKYAFIAGKVPLNDFDSFILYFNRIRVLNTGIGSIKVWMSYKDRLNFVKINV